MENFTLAGKIEAILLERVREGSEIVEAGERGERMDDVESW